MTAATALNPYRFFGISDTPFSIAPDPRFLYLSAKHQEALAHLLYGIATEGGFIVLTGEVGTGKTTVCRSILKQVPDATDVAFIINPRVNATELLMAICDELGVLYNPNEQTNKLLVDVLAEYLLDSHARGRHTLLIIDEAQNLSADVLEQVRLLTNLETDNKKLLQLALIGQPELADMLASDQLRQLAQRVTARYHLDALTREETAFYIQHRLKVAGFIGPLFTPAAQRRVYRASGGVPRLINILCERCMLGAYVQETRSIGPGLVKKAIHELSEPELQARGRHGGLGLPGWLELGRLLVYALIFGVLVIAVDYTVQVVNQPDGLQASAPQAGLPAQAKAQEPLVIAPADAQNPGQQEAAPGQDDHISALVELAQSWALRADPSDDLCVLAGANDLACLEAQLDRAELAQLLVPAIVDNGSRLVFYAGDGEPTAAIGDGPYRVRLLWYPLPAGASALPWEQGQVHTGVDLLVGWRRSDSGVQALIEPGLSAGVKEGAAVSNRFDWLLNGASAPLLPDSHRYDAGLSDWVADFQRANGLKPNGKVDLITLVALHKWQGQAAAATGT